ncbi:hypothetical protein GN958_ATG10024 [Phytophthora infestans]|uniref:Uncharacterized protein n=1 Tax=Phytophthora infestans TaxID=4787 RepID=A0A8S9UIJ4_PHYIN|nr:hypothetical protein GN958_ATG10024 [Phytophthora infestans]
MEDSDSSQDDLLGYGATASIQLGQEEPSPAPEEVGDALHPHASEDEGLICEEVVKLEQRKTQTQSSSPPWLQIASLNVCSLELAYFKFPSSI